MRAGYVVSGVVFLSLATIFGLVAMTLGVYYAILNASGTFCGVSTSSTASSVAVCDAFTAATAITAVAAIVFFAISTIFLWTGFKTPTHSQVVNVMQPVVQFCPNCRTQVSPGMKFCPSCGTKLM